MIRIALAMLMLLALLPAHGADLSPPNPDGPTTVWVRIFVLDIDEVDTAEQSFTANVYMDLSWQDSRLAHAGTSHTAYQTTEVWTPLPQILNRQRLMSTLPEVVEVSADGQVRYAQRFWGKLSQPLQLADFPFDRHTFRISVAAVNSRSGEVVLKQAEDVTSGISDELSLANFKVTDSRMVVEAYRPVQDLNSIPAVHFEFDAVRESAYYIIKIITPLLLIVAMSWIVFWIDPTQSGTQIGLGATAMLTLIANRFAIDSSLPKLAYLTRMDLFILGATVLVFASLLEVVFTAYLANCDRLETARKIDRAMRVVFPLLFVLLALKAFVL